MKKWLGLALIFSALLAGNNMVSYHSVFSVHAMTLVLGITFGILYLRFDMPGLRFWKLDGEMKQKAMAVGGSSALMAGFIGALLGLVHVFENLDDSGKIGPALALSVCSVLYSFVLYLTVFLPFDPQPKMKKILTIPLASLFLVAVQTGLVFVSISSRI